MIYLTLTISALLVNSFVHDGKVPKAEVMGEIDSMSGGGQEEKGGRGEEKKGGEEKGEEIERPAL